MTKGTLDFIERQLTGDTWVKENLASQPGTPNVEAEKKPLGRCEYKQGCRNPAIGRFTYKSFDSSSGLEFGKENQALCEYHRNILKGEMEKVEGSFEEI